MPQGHAATAMIGIHGNFASLPLNIQNISQLQQAKGSAACFQGQLWYPITSYASKIYCQEFACLSITASVWHSSSQLQRPKRSTALLQGRAGL